MNLDLQFFGGRGGSSGLEKSTSVQNQDDALSKAILEAEEKIRYDNLETVIAFNADGSILKTITDHKEDEVDITEAFADFYGKDVLHNHPSDGTFSPEDISALTDLSMGSLRAVGPTHGYLLESDKTASLETLSNRVNMYDDFVAARESFLEPMRLRYENASEAYNRGELSEREVVEMVKQFAKAESNWRREWFAREAKNYGYAYIEY